MTDMSRHDLVWMVITVLALVVILVLFGLFAEFVGGDRG